MRFLAFGFGAKESIVNPGDRSTPTDWNATDKSRCLEREKEHHTLGLLPEWSVTSIREDCANSSRSIESTHVSMKVHTVETLSTRLGLLPDRIYGFMLSGNCIHPATSVPVLSRPRRSCHVLAASARMQWALDRGALLEYATCSVALDWG